MNFDKELEDIKLKIDEVNEQEKERLDQLAAQKQLEETAGTAVLQQLDQGRMRGCSWENI